MRMLYKMYLKFMLAMSGMDLTNSTFERMVVYLFEYNIYIISCSNVSVIRN
jgi:putative AlgH/UPF0301 family transcriptional regulator